MRQITELNFEGQNIYCGIDVHASNWAVCVRDETFELKRFTQPPEPDKLVAFLKRNYPGANYHAVYEAGFCGFWIQRHLIKEGINCIVVHPADVPTTDREKQGKTDGVDCRKLARSLYDNSLRAIYIPDEQLADDRQILRTRKQLVRDTVRFKNRILSVLHFNGIKIPEGYKNSTNFTNRFMSWMENLEMSNSAKVALQLKLDCLKQLRERLLQVNRYVRKLASEERYKKKAELLLSIPGIGITNAMTFLTEIGDFTRFREFDHLCSYIGLIPSIHQSDQTIYVKGVTRRGNHILKEALLESAWLAMPRDPALLMCYKQYCKRMKPNKAIIKIARKLLSRIRHVVIKEVRYEIAVIK